MNWLKRLLGRSEPARTAQTPSDEQKSKAYLAYTEWGPDGVKHRNTKLADVFPDLALETRLAWIAEFNHVEHQVSNVVGKLGERDFKKFESLMRAKFPFMNDKAIQRAWFLVAYYTIHG